MELSDGFNEQDDAWDAWKKITEVDESGICSGWCLKEPDEDSETQTENGGQSNVDDSSSARAKNPGEKEPT